MTAIAIIALILVILWFISMSRRTHKYYFNKYMLIVTIVAVGILTYQANNPAKPTLAQASYNQHIPPVAAAPYLAPTSSRIYYVKNSSVLPDGNPILKEYYTYDKNAWKYSKTELPLYKKVFGEVKLIDRRSQ